MLHLSIFSGTEAEMPPAGFTSLTIFGASELRRPTLAREILNHRARKDAPKSRWSWLFGSDENFVVTIFGASEVRAPTLVEEHTALSALLRSGQIRREEIPALIDGIEARLGGSGAYRTFTLFGSCWTQGAGAKRERKAIETAVSNGDIDERTRRRLDSLVEAPRGSRWRALSEMQLAPA